MTHSPDLEDVARRVLGPRYGELNRDLNGGAVRACEYHTHRDPITGEPVDPCPDVAAPGTRFCPSHLEDLQDIAWDRTRDAGTQDTGDTT